MDTSDSGGSDSEQSPEPVYKFGWLEQRDLEEDPERVREYFVTDPRFSRTIPLDDTGQTITYAEFGDTTPTSDIVLYMQGIIGSRWHIAPRGIYRDIINTGQSLTARRPTLPGPSNKVDSRRPTET
jgi:hypothetical protein